MSLFTPPLTSFGGGEKEKVSLDTYSLSWNEIPQAWTKKWSYGENVSLFAYIDTVMQKVAYLKNFFSASGASGKGAFESGISLHNFFHPGSLMIAIKQQAARVQNCSIHDLALHSSWGLDPIKAMANLKSEVESTFSVDLHEDSTFVLKNILIQGACIGISGTAARLQDVTEQDKVINQAPHAAIGWIKKSLSSASSFPEGLVQLPLYEDMERTSIIERLYVPCDKRKLNDDRQWTVKSVALFVC